MTHQSKITAKGQTTIPAEVREALGLKPGDHIRYMIDQHGVRLIRKNRHMSELAGFLANPPSGAGSTVEEMDQAIGEHLAEEDERIKREWNEGRR